VRAPARETAPPCVMSRLTKCATPGLFRQALLSPETRAARTRARSEELELLQGPQ
jgi:hypothetical protein